GHADEEDENRYGHWHVMGMATQYRTRPFIATPQTAATRQAAGAPPRGHPRRPSIPRAEPARDARASRRRSAAARDALRSARDAADRRSGQRPPARPRAPAPARRADDRDAGG